VSPNTDDYVTLLASLPHLDPMTILSVFFLTLARILPIIVLAPFLGANNLPKLVRMMFGISLVALFLPQNLIAIKTQIPYGMPFIGLMLKELIIGFVLGIFAAAPFYVAQMSGSLIDHSRGSSSLQVNDPTTQSTTGPIGILYNYVLIALFYSLGGPFLFFNALADAYRLIPVDGLVNKAFFNLSIPFWKQVYGYGSYTMRLSVQLASPALIGILLTDMFLGIANRLAPQVQIVFLGVSLKSWVGIALLCAAWGLTLQVLGKESITYFQHLDVLIKQVGYYFSG
jgi:type III secretion protein SpaR/YscT/HrcT